MISHTPALHWRTSPWLLSWKGKPHTLPGYHVAHRHNIQADPCLPAMREKVISKANLASGPCSRLNQNTKWGRQSKRWRTAGRDISVHKQKNRYRSSVHKSLQQVLFWSNWRSESIAAGLGAGGSYKNPNHSAVKSRVRSAAQRLWNSSLPGFSPCS